MSANTKTTKRCAVFMVFSIDWRGIALPPIYHRFPNYHLFFTFSPFFGPQAGGKGLILALLPPKGRIYWPPAPLAPPGSLPARKSSCNGGKNRGDFFAISVVFRKNSAMGLRPPLPRLPNSPFYPPDTPLWGRAGGGGEADSDVFFPMSAGSRKISVVFRKNSAVFSVNRA